MTDYQRRRLMSNRKDYTSRRRLYPNYMGEDMNEMRKSRTANGQYRRRKDYYDNETEYRKPNDYEHDYEYEEEYEGNHPFVIEGEMGFDYAEMSKLSKRDIMEWKHNLVNADGSSDKAFALPQEHTGHYEFFDRSYNVPEFMVEPVRFTPQEFAEIVKGESVNVKYEQNIK